MHGKETNFDGIESSYPVRNGLDSVLCNRAANRIKDGRGGSANEGHDRHPHLATGRCDRGGGSLAKIDFVLSANGPAAA